MFPDIGDTMVRVKLKIRIIMPEFKSQTYLSYQL
jgi:hypothetical protein